MGRARRADLCKARRKIGVTDNVKEGVRSLRRKIERVIEKKRLQKVKDDWVRGKKE